MEAGRRTAARHNAAGVGACRIAYLRAAAGVLWKKQRAYWISGNALGERANIFSVVRDLGASIATGGFKKIVLYNTHGGNTSLVDVLARDLRAEFELRTFSLFGSPGVAFDGVSEQERTYGFHAGEIETAYLLHATPTLVHPKEYTTNYIARVDQPELLKPEASSANFAWLTKDIAPSGVLGDPTAASAENGERWSNDAAARIAELLVAMFNFEPRHGA